MGKYDAIRGAGNVTVQAPPDFWTSAKQSFDDDYDRLVAAQERKNIKEQQDIDNNRAERQLNMQEEQAAMQKEAEERQKYMTELSMIENPTLRAEYAARHGVSKGWTPNEQVEEWKENGRDKLRYETIRGQYLRGDDETKSLLRNKMRDSALEANAPATEFNMLEEIGNKAHSKQSMKAASDIALQFLPEEARTQIGSILKSGIEIDDNILGTIGTIFESTVKAAGTSNTRRIEGKQKMLLGVVEAIGKVDDTTPPLVVKTLNEWHTKLKNDPDIMGNVTETSVSDKPFSFDVLPNIPGASPYSNEFMDEQLANVFNGTVLSVDESEKGKKWSEMDDREKVDAGDKIKTAAVSSMRKSKDVKPTRIQKRKQYKDQVKTYKNKIAKVESKLSKDYNFESDKPRNKRRPVVENQEKEINNLIQEISQIEDIPLRREMVVRLNDMLDKRQKEYAFIRRGLGYKFKKDTSTIPEAWMQPATE